jgi:diguanylate cyclase (GGDEF)-like protein
MALNSMSKRSIAGAPATEPAGLKRNVLDNQNFTNSNEELLVQIVSAIHQVLTDGQVPTDLPPILAKNAQFNRMIGDLSAIYVFSMELANGKLEQDIKIRGKVAGALKSLQANLRHLSWQTQCIAAGDFTQKVDFLGDFSEAFNTMVDHLRQNREALEQHAGELSMQKQNAIKLMLDAQSARDDLEKANAQLKSQLEEIKGLQLLLREQAIRDQLTGLFNRRYLIETLERELARAQRGHYPVSLIMIDLDHFKNLNDTYGHRVGDLVLQSLGKMLLVKTRLGDIPCRYGGEEIIIVFPDVDAEVTTQRAEFLRKAFEELSFNIAGMSIHATLSAGVATFPDHATDMDGLLHTVDQALYAAKAAGRNRVEIYQTSKD